MYFEQHIFTKALPSCQPGLCIWSAKGTMTREILLVFVQQLGKDIVEENITGVNQSLKHGFQTF